jgi:hypothetical protein
MGVVVGSGYLRYLDELDFADKLEQPCFESNINFAAKAFDREASPWRLSVCYTTVDCQ